MEKIKNPFEGVITCLIFRKDKYIWTLEGH